MLRILMVIAGPLNGDLSPVAALEEWQSIARALAHQQAPVTLYRLFPPTWQQLRQTLLGRLGPFDVIHFIGHGNASELILEDELGHMDPVSATDLAEALAQRNVQLVILNVCESQSPARALVRADVPAVVATTGPITNGQAIILAQELYGALAAGQPLAQALAHAQTALRRSEGTEASDVPVMVGNGDLRFDLPRPDAELPRSRILHFPRHNLRQPAAFFGRREELQQGLQALAATDVRVVQVTGLGGIGKTSFGLQLAHRSAWRFFGGVVWMSADAGGGPFDAYLRRGTESVLSIRPTGDPTKDVEAVLERVAEHPVLLIFDDPDRLPDETREGLPLFLKRLPLQGGSKAILLTRTHMPALDDVDGTAVIRLGGLDPENARRFLRRRAALQGVTELAGAPDAVLDEIADRLGYHPKMMELTISLVRVLGLAEGRRTLSRLPGPFAQKLEALLAESVATLKPADTEVLRVSTTFVGPFTAEWLVGVGSPQATDSLLPLMDSNLVDRDQVTGHYELHPVVRDYIAGNMPPDPAHLRSHARFFASRVASLALHLTTAEVQATRREFDYLIGEVHEAVRRMRALDDDEARTIVRDLAVGVRDYLHFHRRDWAAIQSLDEAAVEACRTLGDHPGLGAALTSLGAALAAQGRADEGLARCSEGIEHLTAAGDVRSQSIGYGALGFVHRIRGDAVSAQRAYERGLALARDAGDPSMEVRHLSNLGTVRRMMKDWEGAERLHQQALDLAQEAGDRLSAAILLDQLGTDTRRRGDLDASLRYHRQAYRLKTALGDEIGLRMTRNSLAATLKRLGRPAAAVPLLEETLASLREDDGVLEWWRVLLQLGRMHRDLKAWEAARLYYEMALEMAQTAQYPRGVSMCERGIGLCYEGEGRLRAAREHIVRAMEISTRINDPFLSTLLGELDRIEEGLSGRRGDIASL